MTNCGRLAAAAALACALAAGHAAAQNAGLAGSDDPRFATSPGALDQSDALIELFQLSREGRGDPHLPYVVNRLKKAIADQDLIGFLDLVDRDYFAAQFQLMSRADRSPGDAIGQFACEFFQICDISKRYGFNDIVSMHLIEVSPAGGLTGGTVRLTLELRMWDGLTLLSTVFYDPSNARLSSAVG